jgi:hypothetical protein
MVGGRRARPVTVTEPHGGTELRSAWVRPGNARTIVSCIVANASMFRREVLIAHA